MKLLFVLFNANSSIFSSLFSKLFFLTNIFFLETTAIFDFGTSNMLVLLENVFKSSFLVEISNVFLFFDLLIFV
jgi:hypothetical protein